MLFRKITSKISVWYLFIALMLGFFSESIYTEAQYQRQDQPTYFNSAPLAPAIFEEPFVKVVVGAYFVVVLIPSSWVDYLTEPVLGSIINTGKHFPVGKVSLDGFLILMILLTLFDTVRLAIRIKKRSQANSLSLVKK